MTNANEHPDHEDQGSSITLTIVNEDNGLDFVLKAGPGTPLLTLIQRMYEKLGVTQQADDRLRCESNGNDVFNFKDIKLGKFVEAGHCPCLVWLFAGGTGGA